MMIERLKQFVREYIYGPPTREPELSEPTLFDRLQKEGCVVCHKNPDFTTYEGPSGGMSRNVWCSYCGTRYNIAMFSNIHGVAEIVNEREREEEFRKQRDES